MRSRLLSARVLGFGLFVAACLAVAGVEVGRAFERSRSSSPPAGVEVVEGASSTAATSGEVLFRSTIPDKTFGHLAVASLSDPDSRREVADLTCDRVYFAAGRGLCLTARNAFTSGYIAEIFDDHFNVLHTLRIPGIPSRARISVDGRYGAMTTFVFGDSYAPGNFSTRTTIVRMTDGETVANLEKFTVLRDGSRFHRRNFNFWGVTFARDDTFYATLGSGATTYLVRGNIATRTMRVVTTHAECPSISPDGTRIAFKRSLDSHGSWRLYVLDRRTMREWPLAETESVDDQVEWLDNAHVLYWRGTDVWEVRADGRGRPRLFLTDAASPAVLGAG